jgi:hypothetical protein
MCAYMIPGRLAAAELNRIHSMTFAVEFAANNIVNLLLKLTPTKTLSIINGAPMEIIIGSPVLQPDSISFRLLDVIGAAFWISRDFPSNNIKNEVYGLPHFAEALSQVTAAQVALFDWSTVCLHTELVPVRKPEQSLENWAGDCRMSDAVPTKDDEKLDFGYVIGLGPFANKPVSRYTNLTFKENVGEKPYVVSTNKYSDYLTVADYVDEGRHGYFQEYMICAELAKRLRTGVDLFISPRTTDGTELTDFAIAAPGAIALIESKASCPFEGTPRRAGAVERSLTASVRKAFEQLHRAHDIIARAPETIADERLRLYADADPKIVSICIVDDALMINKRSLTASLTQLGGLSSSDRTYILDLEDFFGLLRHSRSADDIVRFLRRLARSVPICSCIPVVNIEF